MCGIAGVVGHAQAEEWVSRIVSAQRHRGPEGAGVKKLAEHVALGHTRLKIVDLSDQAAQPMTSRDGRWTITFNGEIFNYRDLRSKLAVPFRSTSDTEVLLEAIAAWGVERTLAEANGMFAFALWDSLQQELLLARDRVGEKPLVYFWNGVTFAFASELKALAGLHGAVLSAPALDAYLGLGYVPAPMAIFRNTYKLPPGHLARVRAGNVDVRRWWFPPNKRPSFGDGDHASQLKALLHDALGLRCLADVPVALALSGGIDSSVLAAELKQVGASSVDAFTVVFNGDESDLPYARMIAEQFQLRHEVIRAEAGGGSPLEDWTTHYDEPFADSSAIGCLALARAVRGHAKVILNGDGGDEAFGGYRHYEHIGIKQWAKSAAAAVGWLDGSRGSVYVESKTIFREREREALLNRHGVEGLKQLLRTDSYLQEQPDGALKQAMWTDLHLGLANGLTYKMDTALSAHGIEGRAPFLDHRILEWTRGLDEPELVRGREKKVLLREVYRERLPQTILDRKKHGFGAPVQTWLDGPLREQAESLLPCPLLDPQYQRGLTGQRKWTLFALSQWAKQWEASW